MTTKVIKAQSLRQLDGTDRFERRVVFLSLCRHLRAAEIDDLKAFRGSKFSGNPYQGFFQFLAHLSTTNLSEDTIHRAHRRATSDTPVESELSTSSNEDSREMVSTAALNDLVRYTLMNMKTYHELATSPTPEGTRPKLDLVPGEARFKFSLGGVRHEVVNDSYIGVNYPGSMSGSDRISQLPVVNMECKPRNAGGLKRGSGEPERFSPSVFAQEVAELIGSMFKQHQATLLPCKSKDQESFVLSMHGTLFYLSTAYFPPDYIAYLEKGQHAKAGSLYLWVRRSVHFDLKNVGERIEALRCIWALIRYITSGEAKLNIVSSAIELRKR
ncbi:hypothetical protein BO78DRAFT_368958 [Aspergillus sclerotiicarbonarius CBS 121057]|uniref:Uncharacterized protein n=1 Tax=Aspergillus sclerotiicarbonarius (strain CBS 121057 / IBT 28362) TaxID=1448318 RepID=A0A319EIX0_ASPSB|nr:hypothetical protein BO78DRAFT_368958 [Aspergillus sclerotiicarbonarius CBS 121057]